MTPTKQIIQFSLDREFVQNLYYFTSKKILVWKPTHNGTDCQYVAYLGDVTFEINCDPKSNCIIINGTKYFVGDQVTQSLCQLILQQRKDRSNKEGDTNIENVKRMFDEILTDSDIEG
jgi:hypothetical protein